MCSGTNCASHTRAERIRKLRARQQTLSGYASENLANFTASKRADRATKNTLPKSNQRLPRKGHQPAFERATANRKSNRKRATKSGKPRRSFVGLKRRRVRGHLRGRLQREDRQHGNLGFVRFRRIARRARSSR